MKRAADGLMSWRRKPAVMGALCVSWLLGPDSWLSQIVQSSQS